MAYIVAAPDFTLSWLDGSFLSHVRCTYCSHRRGRLWMADLTCHPHANAPSPSAPTLAPSMAFFTVCPLRVPWQELAGTRRERPTGRACHRK